MPQFAIDKLVVLHLYKYCKPKGEKDPLQNVEKSCQVVKLSTCMRTIYVSTTDAMPVGPGTPYEQFSDYINKKEGYSSIEFERLEGQAAYRFLLYWMIGGFNPKNTLSDVRIKGDVRLIWDKIVRSSSPYKQKLVPIYRNLFDVFFEDSAKISKLIPVYIDLEKEELEDRLKLICRTCSWARTNGFLSSITSFDYRHFGKNSYIDALQNVLEKSEKKLISKAIFSSPRSGSKVVFFKSNYEITDANLNGITKRLESIRCLLTVLEQLKCKTISSNIDQFMAEDTDYEQSSRLK